MTTVSPSTTAAWTRLMRARHRVLTEVEATLRRAGKPPLSWYDALWELEQAGPAGLRPNELEKRMLLPQYGLSRLLSRLEAAGHIRRQPCPDDGRGQIVLATESGVALRRAMWPPYARALDRALASRLSETEARDLADLLSRLAD